MSRKQGKLLDRGIRALVFDVDDTLVLTARNGFRKCLYVAQQLKLAPLSEEQFLAAYGRYPFQECVRLWYPQLKYPEQYQTVYDQLADLFPDIPAGSFWDVVQRGKEAGLYIGILTNGPARKTWRKLRALNIETSMLDGIWHAGNLDYIKPDPRAFEPLCAAWRLSSGGVMYVGDSLTDLLAAQRAHVPFLAVLTGIVAKATFLKHLPAEQIVDCIDDLMDWL